MSGFESPFHIMPTPSNLPWNSQNIAWANAQKNMLMEFKAQPFDIENKSLHFKRRAPEEAPIPCKQIITEDKMAAHLSGLHISSDFTAHNYQNNFNLDTMSDDTLLSTMQTDPDYKIPMTTKDLEERLKNANSISICEEIKKLHQDNILPNSLVTRIEKPCTALVLWQPPPSITNLIVPSAETKNTDENDIDNNNSIIIDLNNDTMDIEM